MRNRRLISALIAGVAITLVAGAVVATAGASPGSRDPRLWTPPAISSGGFESSPTFSPDGRTMIFIAADEKFLNFQLKQSMCKDGQWSKPEAVPFATSLPVIEADPSFTHDGKRLYFISSRHAPEREDFDIWFVERLSSGRWGKPQRLPEPVNSPGAELLPRMTSDGHLYFGSDRPGGFGQGDIYVAKELEPGRWSVRNLGAPINSSDHEVEAEISRDGKSMIIVADRPKPSHLYRYIFKAGKWALQGRIPASDDVFQVGPLLSPKADRLLFAQRHENRSGEIFVTDLAANPDQSWPPDCRDQTAEISGEWH